MSVCLSAHHNSRTVEQIAGLKVLTAPSMKMAVFWIVVPKVGELYQTTSCYNPEDGNLRFNRFFMKFYIWEFQ
jgi:hypothetical protein